VLYIWDKFPRLDPKRASQLGKTISRRRELLFYRLYHGGSLEAAKAEPKTTVIFCNCKTITTEEEQQWARVDPLWAMLTNKFSKARKGLAG
jgi:hypothetical protein